MIKLLKPRKLRKTKFTVAADADDVEECLGLENRTQTIDGRLTVCTRKLGIWEFSPITNTCCKSFKTEKRAKELNNKLIEFGVRSMVRMI